jgi:hypothetical protein
MVLNPPHRVRNQGRRCIAARHPAMAPGRRSRSVRVDLAAHQIGSGTSGKTGRSGEPVEQRAPAAGRSDSALIGPPGAGVSEAPMHHHVASAAQAVRADVGAKRFTIVLRVRLDYPMVLAAGITHGRSLPAAGGVFGSQPPKRAYALVVVESVVGLHCLFPLTGSLKLRSSEFPPLSRGARGSAGRAPVSPHSLYNMAVRRTVGVRLRGSSDAGRRPPPPVSDAIDPSETLAAPHEPLTDCKIAPIAPD